MPFLTRHIGLSQNSFQKRCTNIGSMRVWNMDVNLTSRHKLMLPSRKWAFKSKCSQTSHQLTMRNRTNATHAASRAFKLYFRTDGTNCCLRTLSSNHSSRTSCNSANASFFVRPCAQTPLKEGSEQKYGKGSSIFSIFALAMTSVTYWVNMTQLYHIPL